MGAVVKNQKKSSEKPNEEDRLLTNLKFIADTIALHNGKDCEVCIHDLTSKNITHSIVYIVNNHVTGRNVGDSYSFNYLKSRKKLLKGKELEPGPVFSNEKAYGKYLKCSTVYIKDEEFKYHYMLCINQDVSRLVEATKSIEEFISSYEEKKDLPDDTLPHVNDILDQLITQAIKYVGKTPANMNTLDKKQAIQYLNDAGAFLISKSGDRVSEYFELSKYSIYAYIKEAEENENKDEDLDEQKEENKNDNIE